MRNQKKIMLPLALAFSMTAFDHSGTSCHCDARLLSQDQDATDGGAGFREPDQNDLSESEYQDDEEGNDKAGEDSF